VSGAPVYARLPKKGVARPKRFSLTRNRGVSPRTAFVRDMSCLCNLQYGEFTLEQFEKLRYACCGAVVYDTDPLMELQFLIE
jgi:hypothetical protein